MLTFLDRGAKTAPSQYPKLPFHATRCFQLVSSIIVGGIMSYFIYQLTHDDWKTPWTFILLASASLASIAGLAFTIFLHCFTGLNPRLNIAINTFLAVLWAVSWSLLTWFLSGTLGSMCDFEHWDEDVGIMVCRIYKALFAFTLVGFVSTLAALGLDIYVRRKQTSRGVYRLHDLNAKTRPVATRGPFTDADEEYGSGGLGACRGSDIWEESTPYMDSQDEQSNKLMREDDTEYRGGRADVSFR